MPGLRQRGRLDQPGVVGDPLGAFQAAISTKTTGRHRYRTAFENGTMDEADAGMRLRELRTEIDALTIRRDEITDAIEEQPTPPSPATLDRVREHLAYVIAEGTPAERKATVEQLIAEIRLIEDDQVICAMPSPGGAEVTAHELFDHGSGL